MNTKNNNTRRDYREGASAKQVGDRFRIHPETVRRMARAGKIPGFRTGRTWRFDLDEVEAALRNGAAE